MQGAWVAAGLARPASTLPKLPPLASGVWRFVCPRPIGVVENGDEIEINAETRVIRVNIPDEEMEARLAAFTPNPPVATKGTLRKYVQLVSSASKGCVTDEGEVIY